MAIHLVRHAKAGSRPDWAQPDDLRPLTEAGRQQAEALVGVLADQGVKRVLTSRYVRCAQTVGPLADHLGLDVEEHDALAEEAEVGASWALLEELATTDAVLCSHGNVIGALLDRLHRRGVKVRAGDIPGKKGSLWTVEVAGDGSFRRATHTPPPR